MSRAIGKKGIQQAMRNLIEKEKNISRCLEVDEYITNKKEGTRYSGPDIIMATSNQTDEEAIKEYAALVRSGRTGFDVDNYEIYWTYKGTCY